ncbi:hypothetical protein L484_001092 [Morus notabilis]|uniref:Non-haem dioxygenase N-terminal domain-containing protein n=1 Tax=Morus notabilis TaxID=981085 RepID=W9SJM6_9ROSA|nr:1-aminocyclopropane-1-carboxylate oxidase homolog [Morus notabilis]EXC31870.1 hypothetical protein L484_001092 [Morus notabilis]
MVATTKDESLAISESNYDRLSEQRAFDDTKAGVKGLVDSGITKIPRFFCNQSNDINKYSISGESQLSIPVIDLKGLTKDPIQREEIVERVREASKTWGFFQVVNHGISLSVLEEMENAVRQFFEQDTELKKEFYTRDVTRKVVYNSNFDLFNSPMATWRDTFFSFMAPNPPKPEELPEACRKYRLMINSFQSCHFVNYEAVLEYTNI